MLHICRLWPWDPGYKGTMTADEARALIHARMFAPYARMEGPTIDVAPCGKTEEKKDSDQEILPYPREETKEINETKVRAVRIDFTGRKFVIRVQFCWKDFNGNSDDGVSEYVWLETVLDDVAFLLTETALVRAIRTRREILVQRLQKRMKNRL